MQVGWAPGAILALAPGFVHVATDDHDVVYATSGDCPEGWSWPEPFKIKDNRKTLRLLVHFVGGLHEPLYVGVPFDQDALILKAYTWKMYSADSSNIGAR